jgi:ribosome-associated toxin RatA of RatAB toxin-antitoxin module
MRVSVSTTIARPAETLFWLSQDYNRRLEWDKYLAEAYLVGSATVAAVGVESFCKNRGGSVLVSKYISFSPPSHAAVQMISGPWVLSKFGGTWRFERIDDHCTKVRFIYNFKVRPAVLKWFIEPIIGGIYRRDMQRRIAAFKNWAEQEAD